jgi:hypothetical protein
MTAAFAAATALTGVKRALDTVMASDLIVNPEP